MTGYANRILHVANGSSVTDTLALTGIPGAMSIWADPLHSGPVPGGLSDEELVEVRTRFLLGEDGGEDAEHWNDLRRWRSVIDNHESYDELVLWFEHDLFDQLNLIQLLSYLRARPPAGVVSLICINAFPGHPDFHGLGELTAPELASLFETRHEVIAAEYELAVRAWQAFREPAPEGLDRVRHSDTSAMPYLARALERFLEEYPSSRDGLSRSERRLLQLAGEELSLPHGFRRMHEGEDAYYISDVSFLDSIEVLSNTAPPLVRVVNKSLQLTEAGREILAGQKDRVSCGLDRWMGGVHLKAGETTIWRWDPGQRRITSNPNGWQGT